jgi:hypothetical protein
MRKGWSVVVVAVLVFVGVLELAGMASAAPKVTEHGKNHPVAWGLKSWKTAQVYMKTDTAGTWVVIDVLSSKGVVAKLYSGKGPAPGVRLWSPAWAGTASTGKHLPTGNYSYRIRVTKSGVTASATGPILVCRSTFAFTTTDTFHSTGTITDTLTRYVYGAPVIVYWRAHIAPGYTQYYWWADSVRYYYGEGNAGFRYMYLSPVTYQTEWSWTKTYSRRLPSSASEPWFWDGSVDGGYDDSSLTYRPSDSTMYVTVVQ